MTTILGIDPGSRITGFGVVRMDGHRAEYVEAGCIKVTDRSLPRRLAEIFSELGEAIERLRPDEVAIEKVFVHANVDSALKLGQARGAAIVAAANNGLAVAEYSPNEIKQAIVGRGHADKQQVQHMVRALLSLEKAPQADAADALAVALCHAHTRQGVASLAIASLQR
ncbi:MAG: crossover junction endodeoxyribonuclease RuvC [Pseudomonadota bacterium]